MLQLQLLEHLDAGHAGHHHVKDDHVELAQVGQLQGLLAVGRLLHAKAAAHETPGYGFAEAPKAQVEAWTRLVRDYLRGRPNLLRVLLLIDCRHGLKDADRTMMKLLDEAAVSYQAVLTKADKIKPPRLAAMVAETEAELAAHAAAFARVLATSSQGGSGIPELKAELALLAAGHGVLPGASASP